jgi:cytochrome c oxidase cbb3-type subunit 3
MLRKGTWICVLLGLIAISCKREERGFKVQPPSAETIEALRLSELHPGPATSEIVSNIGLSNFTVANITNLISTNAPKTNQVSTNATSTNQVSTNASSTNAISTNSVSTNKLPSSAKPAAGPVKNLYEENAYALSEGKQLYSYFNCIGCHANGGGGMGPALMDDKWIYGSNPEQIFATIVEGRPNGMPSWRGRIPDYQVWMLAAYVRSLSGLVPKDAAPGRSDHMKGKKPENSIEAKQPKISSVPKPQ